MHRILLIVLWLGSFTKLFSQQEEMVTQFMYNRISLNSAVAGNEQLAGVGVLIRDQWNGLPKSPKIQMFSLNFPAFNDKFGAGINLKNSTVGIFRNLTLSGMYAYRIKLSGDYIFSLGLEASYRNRTADFTNTDLLATQGLSNDPSIPKIKVVNNLFNVGTGAYLSNNKYFVGISIPRLIKNNIDFDNNKVVSNEVRHLFLMGGVLFPINKEINLSTQTLFKLSENAPFSGEINASITLDDKYTGGLTYRLGGGQGDFGESIDVLFGFNLSENLKAVFSIDFTTSQLKQFDNGSLELGVFYSLAPKKKKLVYLNPRYF